MAFDKREMNWFVGLIKRACIFMVLEIEETGFRYDVRRVLMGWIWYLEHRRRGGGKGFIDGAREVICIHWTITDASSMMVRLKVYVDVIQRRSVPR